MTKVKDLPRIPDFPDYAYDIDNNNVWSFKRTSTGHKITYILGWQHDRIFQMHNLKGMHYIADTQIIRLLYAVNKTPKTFGDAVTSATQILDSINNTNPRFYVAQLINGLPVFNNIQHSYTSKDSAELEGIRLHKTWPDEEFVVIEYLSNGKSKQVNIIDLKGVALYKAMFLAIHSDQKINLVLTSYLFSNQNINDIVHSVMDKYSVGRNADRNSVTIEGYTSYDEVFHVAFFKAYCLKILGHEIPSVEVY